MKLLGIFMWYRKHLKEHEFVMPRLFLSFRMTPLGIVSLIAGNLLELNDLNNTAGNNWMKKEEAIFITAIYYYHS